MKRRLFLSVVLVVFVLLAASACGGGSNNTAANGQTGEIPNPASANCEAVGGTLQIEDGPNGQVGVCYFDDNRQCEEWALYRGECPVGGVKVTGYITQAGRFCAISGGIYDVTAAGDAETEKGACTFNNGVVCDAAEFYNGTCARE